MTEPTQTPDNYADNNADDYADDYADDHGNTLTVNGEEAGLPEPPSIAGLLAVLGLDPGKVAVEHNRKLVRGDRYADSALRPGDDVEIVTFVGGG